MNPNQDAISQGVSFDAVGLLTLRLSEAAPRPAGSVGQPPLEAIFEMHSSEGTTIGVWECTPGRFATAKDGIGEMMQLIAGRATITSEDGTVHDVVPGSVLVLPDGWRGEWEVHETVRKVFSVWESR
jgi:hypothetical protein